MVRDGDQHALTSLISISALSEPELDFRDTHFSTIRRVLYLERKSFENAFSNLKEAK